MKTPDSDKPWHPFNEDAKFDALADPVEREAWEATQKELREGLSGMRQVDNPEDNNSTEQGEE